jgi:hypothetical protein
MNSKYILESRPPRPLLFYFLAVVSYVTYQVRMLVSISYLYISLINCHGFLIACP